MIVSHLLIYIDLEYIIDIKFLDTSYILEQKHVEIK